MMNSTVRLGLILAALCPFLALDSCLPGNAGQAAVQQDSRVVNWPVDSSGYTLEPIADHFSASYARGKDIFLGLDDGRIMLADDQHID